MGGGWRVDGGGRAVCVTKVKKKKETRATCDQFNIIIVVIDRKWKKYI